MQSVSLVSLHAQVVCVCVHVYVCVHVFVCVYARDVCVCVCDVCV